MLSTKFIIIKGSLHCLTSVSKGRFLVNNVLMFGYCMMSGDDANPIFFNKKIKIGRPEHFLPPVHLRPITSHFCLTPHLLSTSSTSKVDVVCVSPPNNLESYFGELDFVMLLF